MTKIHRVANSVKKPCHGDYILKRYELKFDVYKIL